MLHYYDLKISETFIYENYLINQIKEGIHIEPCHAKLLKEVLEKHFTNTPMIYISNRMNSYSVDPMIYKKISKYENLIAMAIVVYDKSRLDVAEIERQFFEKTFMIFESLKDAIVWTYQELEKIT